MLISPDEINKILALAETRKINSGKKMFEQSRVKIIDVSIKNSDNYNIDAVVYDSKNNNQFISMAKNHNGIEIKCDCKEYSANYATCSHAIAVLFDVYVNCEKYEHFKKEDNIASLISSNNYKNIPVNINKNTIYSSFCTILSSLNLEALYDFVVDIIRKNAYKTYITSVQKFFDGSKIKNFEKVEKSPNIIFNISKENGSIIIKSNVLDYKFFILKNDLAFIEDDRLYVCPEDFTFNVLPYIIFVNYIKNDTVKIKEENFKVLYQKVLVNIFSFGKIQDTNNILSNYNVINFKTNIYLDMESNKDILATLTFLYDNYKINPLSKPTENPITRNELMELKVIKLLNDLGFKIDVKREEFIINSDDDKFEFLKHGLLVLTSNYTVFATEKFKKKQIISSSKNKVGVTLNNNLIQLDISNINYTSSELSDILKAYKLNKKYYKLKNDDYLDLNDENIKTLSLFLEEIHVQPYDIKSGKINLPRYRAMYLDKILSSNTNIYTTVSSDFKDIIKSTTNYKNKKYEIPAGIGLRNYQIDGYNWIKTLQEFNFGGILADDMGLGKTIQLIAVLLDSKEKDKGTSLVVCPTSLYFNWQKEIEKFAPGMSTLVICGTQKNRESLIKKIKKYDVIITSYDLVKRDIEQYLKYEFNYVIADEAQYIKNTNTQNSKAIKKLNAKNRIALTGTPMENSLSELWSIFDFIMPGYLFSYNKFKELYEKKIVLENDKTAYDRLLKLISPFILRRKKQDVLDDLPSKTETPVYSDMTEEQKELYNVFLNDAKNKIKEYKENNMATQNRIEILSLITRLRQICIHPKMFIDNYVGKSAKLEQMIELLKDIIASGHKVLIFSSFTSMLEIVEQRLNSEKITYFKLTGKTDTAKRLEYVEEFNNSANISVFLVSLKAGGTGLNLIGADIVMHLDPWWNVAKEEQATDRTYRIGQKKNIQVFKFITKDSIEEKILKMQERKDDLIDRIIKTDKDISLKFNLEDILKILE